MNDKMYWIAIITAIIMFGLYEIVDLGTSRMMEMQKVSRQVIEK
jgi:hypothetical protein